MLNFFNRARAQIQNNLLHFRRDLEHSRRRAVDSAYREYHSIYVAVNQNDFHTAARLMGESNGWKNYAHENENFLLRLSSFNKHPNIVKYLLTIPAVRNNAEAKGSLALLCAIEDGYIDIVLDLLTIPSVREYETGNDFKPLRNAAEHGHLEVLEALIKDDIFRDQITHLNNSVLKDALEHKHFHIAQRLLSIKSVQQCLLDNDGEQLLELVKENHAFSAMAILELTVYGIPLATLLNGVSYDKRYAVLEQYLKQPTLYLTSKKYPLATIEAVNILHRKESIESYQRKIAENERNRERFNNPDDERRIGSVRTHYNNVIKPHFQLTFESYGATNLIRIEKIESKIRAQCLKAIESEAQDKPGDERARSIVAFIASLTQENKELLCQANHAALMAQARTLFNDHSSEPQTAWRAYDAHAPIASHPKNADFWPNLLTEPSENIQQMPSYTVSAVGLPSPSIKMASDLSREMFAYSFLLANDPADGDDAARELRNMVFIAKVAELRRAHNKCSRGLDDPSCLPGTISRAGDTWVSHAKGIVPNRLQLFKEELKTIILEVFQSIPKVHHEHYFEALSQCSSYTALDIINKKQVLSDEKLALRKQVIDSLGSLDDIHVKIAARFIARGSVELLSDEEVSLYGEALISDIGGPWLIKALTTVYRGAQLDNPYAALEEAPLQQTIGKQQAITLMVDQLKDVQFVNKNSVIMESAKDFAQGNIERGFAMIKSNPNSAAKEPAIRAALSTFKPKAQNPLAQKAKYDLWEKLNHAFANQAIENKGDTLKEIVEAVITHKHELNTVLQGLGLPLIGAAQNNDDDGPAVPIVPRVYVVCLKRDDESSSANSSKVVEKRALEDGDEHEAKRPRRN